MADIKRHNAAIHACQVVAQRYGVNAQAAVVLSDRENIIIHLAPTPAIARLTESKGNVRTGSTWLSNELNVCQHMAAHNAPIVRPYGNIPATIHIQNGFIMSFWDYVELLDTPGTPTQIGQRLVQCHQALQNCSDDLPIFPILEETATLLETGKVSQQLPNHEYEFLQHLQNEWIRHLPSLVQSSRSIQAIHGDANLDNVLNTSQGVLWSDWEDTFIGPIEWDLACLINRAIIFSTETDAAQSALRGYGITQIAPHWTALRTFQVLLWNLLTHEPDTPGQAHAMRRLQWLHAHC